MRAWRRAVLLLCGAGLLLATACSQEQTIVEPPHEKGDTANDDAGVDPSDEGPPPFSEEAGPVDGTAPPPADADPGLTCGAASDCVGKIKLEPCKLLACQGGACTLSPGAENLPCDDGDSCTVGATCTAGACTGGSPLPCDDANPCTQDACDPAEGCLHTPAAGACDDGNPCTLADHCVEGACQSGNSACPCETDVDCAQWEDGSPCNGQLVCLQKVCKIAPGSVAECPSGTAGPCKAFGCDPVTGQCGAQPLPDGKPCSDGEVCTHPDTCQGGECVAGEPVCACTDDNSCLLFDDGDLCNGVRICIAGQCQTDPTSPVTCPGADDPCAPGACNPLTGQCESQPKDGQGCDDGDPCSTGDVCEAGACAGVVKTCDDSNPCTDDSCVFSGPAAGSCVNTPNAAPCDDGDECTSPDLCQGGACSSGADQCACSKQADCLKFEADKCKGEMQCLGGKCVPTAPVLCDQSKNTDCASNQCNPATGQCAPAPINEGAPCFGSDPCAEGAVCAGGTCKGGVSSCACEPGNLVKCGDSLPWANDAFGATDNIDAWACMAGDYSGKEYAFSFKSASPKLVTVSLSKEQKPVDVFVLEASADNACLPGNCVKAHVSKAEFIAEAGKIYYIVADGKAGQAGKFDLFVDCSGSFELNCGDGVDDDCDGQTDCADADCAENAICDFGENCINGVDDDGDLLADCEDSDCLLQPACAAACIPTASAYCGLNTFWQTGGYNASNDVENYGCVAQPYDGPEFVYTYHATKTVNATVLLETAFAGHKIFVMQDQGIGCNGSSCIQSGSGQVSFLAVQGVTYYLAIDGANKSEGDFKIKLLCE